MERRLSAPEREGLLEQVFRHSSQGILVASAEGRVVDANDAFLFLLGRDRDEVVGRSTGDLGLFASIGEGRAQELLRERETLDADAHVLTPSGEARVIRLWAEAVTDGGDPIVVVRASDFAGRIAAGTRYYELREAEVRYRALVEQIPAITYTELEDESSPVGYRDIYISPQTERILGYTPFEWQSDPELWIRTLHPDDRERVVKEDSLALETGTFTSEYRMISRNGQEVWFRDEAAVIEDPITGVRFWQGIMLDITELKIAEATQAEIAAKYRTLVEQIPSIVYLGEYGEQGDWLYISPQLERVLGYTPQEWLVHPHPMASFTHPDDLEIVRAEEDRSLHSGDPFRAEYRMRAKDGRWLWMRDEATAVRDQSGHPFVLQGVMYDVTERKRAEQELAAALERLQALDRLKNTLLHALSHDLQNPITVILGAASTLERLDHELTEEDRQNLIHSLASRARSVKTLVADLLDMERLDQGIAEPLRMPIDLSQIVRDMVETSEALVERQVDVKAEPVTVSVDRPKIERIMENLLANASRHTDASCRIWVQVKPKGPGALIVVEDDGRGVPDDQKERIFEAFSRGPGAAFRPGSGIGLSIVARFAELHGGRAWVEDRRGGGASFRVFLPDLPATRAEPAAS